MHVFYHSGLMNTCVEGCILELASEGVWGTPPLQDQLVRATVDVAKWMHGQRTFIDSGHRPMPFTRALLHFETNTSEPLLSDTFKCGHTRIFSFWLQSKLSSFPADTAWHTNSAGHSSSSASAVM